MRKVFTILIALIFFGLLLLSGCTVYEEETDKGIFGTEKSKTTIGPEGIKKTTKTCPIWNPDCDKRTE